MAEAGDLLIVHRLSDGFVVVDAVSHEQVSVFPTFTEALSHASLRTADKVWHQTADNRGRPMGDPVLVFQKERK